MVNEQWFLNLKKNWPFLTSLFLYTSFFSLGVSLSLFLINYLNQGQSAFENRMSTFTETTGKNIPKEFSTVLDAIKIKENNFQQITVLLICLMIIGTFFFILYYFKKEERKPIFHSKKKIALTQSLKKIILPLSIAFLLSLGILILCENSLLQGLKGQLNEFLSQEAAGNFNLTFAAENSGLEALLPYSPENFLKLNTYLEGTTFTLVPAYLITFLSNILWCSFLLLVFTYFKNKKSAV